ncbi:hypothetical protein ACS0TY_012146 [Phlomoides rotata]
MASRIRETIVECMKEARFSSSDEDRCQALQTLATITKISPQNRNLVAHIEGSVAALVSLSKSTSQNVQYLSLSVLFNLSLNPSLKQYLAQEDIISYLTTLILSPNHCKLAASFLCSLAMLDKNKAKFGVAGIVQVLVKAISGPQSPASHHLLSSLAELVQFHGNCTLAVRAGAVAVLLEVAKSEDLSGTSLAILGLVARFEEGLNELKGIDGIVARMLVILKRPCILSKEGACEILLRLFDESEDCVREAGALPELSSTLAEVSLGCSGRLREKASLLMNKIMESG